MPVITLMIISLLLLVLAALPLWPYSLAWGLLPSTVLAGRLPMLCAASGEPWVPAPSLVLTSSIG